MMTAPSYVFYILIDTIYLDRSLIKIYLEI